MTRNQIVKASLFTLILAFMTIGTIVVAAVMNKDNGAKEKKVFAPTTWYFIGSETDDPNNPSNYSLTPLEDVECGGESEVICSIRDEASTSNPNQPKMSFGQVTTDTPNNYQKTHRVD